MVPLHNTIYNVKKLFAGRRVKSGRNAKSDI